MLIPSSLPIKMIPILRHATYIPLPSQSLSLSELNYPTQTWPVPSVHPQLLVDTSLMEPISLFLLQVASVLVNFFISQGRDSILLKFLYSNETKMCLSTWQFLINSPLLGTLYWSISKWSDDDWEWVQQRVRFWIFWHFGMEDGFNKCFYDVCLWYAVGLSLCVQLGVR